MSITISERVAAELWRCEAEVGTAMSSTGGLLQVLVAAEGEANLSAVLGAPTMQHLGASIAALSTARAELGHVHRLLERLRVTAGLPLVPDGAGGDKKFAQASVDRLQAVVAA